MSFKRKILAGLMSAGLITGIAVVGADSASASPTPVCYYKKTIKSFGPGSRTEYTNVVLEQYALQYPARTKTCHVVQTAHVVRPLLPDYRFTVYDGWIQVRY